MAEDRHAERAEQARRDIERLQSEGEVIGSSAMVRAAKRAQAHFSAAEAPGDDPAELWGRRIGRALALVALLALLWLFVRTYVMP